MNSNRKFDVSRLVPLLTTVLSVLGAAAQVGSGVGLALSDAVAPGSQSCCAARAPAVASLGVHAPRSNDESQ